MESASGTTPGATANVSVGPTDLEVPAGENGKLGNGTFFEITGLFPGLYQPPYIALPKGWVVSHMRYGGVELVNGPIVVDGSSQLEITITDQFGSVVGTVLDKKQELLPATVALVPDAAGESIYRPQSHLIQRDEVDDNGNYKFQWVLPGSYTVVPLYGDKCNSYDDLKTVREHPQGYKAIKVEPGKTVQVTLVR